MEEECFFTCPYCWQRISMMLDTSVSNQTYVEDCEVCCNPILLRIKMHEGAVTDIEAFRENG